jgi:hypothetical protein
MARLYKGRALHRYGVQPLRLEYIGEGSLTSDSMSISEHRFDFEEGPIMKWIVFSLVVVAAVAVALGGTRTTAGKADKEAESISNGKLPNGYRDWRLISVAREEGELDDIRAVLGNDKAINAYRDGKSPRFRDGTIIGRIAWSYDASEENNKTFGKNQSFVARRPKNGVQFMVKDSKKYASTGGWGYFQFDDGKPLADQAMLKSCFDCHSLIKDRDFVFTRYAP